jgi:phage FluMu protein Com
MDTMEGVQSMIAIISTECQNCGKVLRGVADTRLVCPMCNTMNKLPPPEEERGSDTTGGWKRVADETPITVGRKD